MLSLSNYVDCVVDETCNCKLEDLSRSMPSQFLTPKRHTPLTSHPAKGIITISPFLGAPKVG